MEIYELEIKDGKIVKDNHDIRYINGILCLHGVPLVCNSLVGTRAIRFLTTNEIDTNPRNNMLT